jgi:hypothetical protein
VLEAETTLSVGGHLRWPHPRLARLLDRHERAGRRRALAVAHSSREDRLRRELDEDLARLPGRHAGRRDRDLGAPRCGGGHALRLRPGAVRDRDAGAGGLERQLDVGVQSARSLAEHAHRGVRQRRVRGAVDDRHAQRRLAFQPHHDVAAARADRAHARRLEARRRRVDRELGLVDAADPEGAGGVRRGRVVLVARLGLPDLVVDRVVAVL